MSPWIHLGAKRAGIRKLLTHAGNPPFGGLIQKYFFTYLTYFINVASGAKIVVPSKFIMDEFRSIPFLRGRHLRKIFNCIRVDRFISRNAGMAPTQQSIMVATLENHKDHKTLLFAWKIVESRLPHAELLLVGDGRLSGQLKGLATTLELQRVTFMGARNDVPDLLWSSFLFILSTTSGEGFGTVLIEALAAGLKVVASDVPACREVLQDGKYGKLVPAGNAEALAEAIGECYEHELCEEERRDQIAYATSFSPERMMEQYLRVTEAGV